jgi:ankyrin repeat protein
MQKSLFLILFFSCLAFMAQALEIDDGPHSESAPPEVIPAPQPKPQSMTEILSVADEETINTLLKQGFALNSRDENGDTPLIFVLKNNDNLNVARLMIEAGADINAPNKEGMTPLLVATETANNLLKQQKILSAAQINKVSLIPEEQLRGRTAYQMKRAEKMLRILLHYGADINQETPFGTPLMSAATSDLNINILNILLNSGAKVNAQDQNGQSALFYARAHDAVEAEALLIKYGADINLLDRYGRTYMDAESAE